MSRTAATVTPGNTNRRFIMLAVALGLLGAILVYAAFSRGSSTSSSGGPGTLAVVVAKSDIPARTVITAAMLDVRLVNEDGRSALAYGDPAQVVGQVTRFPIAMNEQVLSTKVVNLAGTGAAISRSLSYTIPAGKRAFSIGANEVRDVGGLLLPGDYVDIMVLYDVEFGGNTRDAYLVQVLMQNVEILAVSQTIVDVVPESTPTQENQRARNSEARPNPEAGTVTLALTPEEAQRIYLAESNGSIRFALRPFGDGNQRPIDFMTENDLFPQNIPNPFSR